MPRNADGTRGLRIICPQQCVVEGDLWLLRFGRFLFELDTAIRCTPARDEIRRAFKLVVPYKFKPNRIFFSRTKLQDSIAALSRDFDLVTHPFLIGDAPPSQRYIHSVHLQSNLHLLLALLN